VLSTKNKNIFIFLIIFILVIDAFPSFSKPHAFFKSRSKPIINALGLWQGPWRLFAPHVDKDNSRILADIHFADGEVVHWESPDWSSFSPLDKFIKFRHMEYYDNLAFSVKPQIWDDFGLYLSTQIKHPTNKDIQLEKIDIIATYATIPEPTNKVYKRPYLIYDYDSEVHSWKPEK